MSARVPVVATRDGVTLSAQLLEPDPAGNFFRRHLPPNIENRRIDCDVLRADYARMAAMFDEKVAALVEHFRLHGIELFVCAAINPDKARYYIADLGHACAALEKLCLEETTAVPLPRGRVR